MTKARFLASALLFAGLAFGLEVSPDSPCAKRCLKDPEKGDASDKADSSTLISDLTCRDATFEGTNATDAGKKFADCQSCMQSSGYEHQASGERDSGWYQFNNRATVDWCLFGRFAEDNNTRISTTYPHKQCNSKCQKIRDSTDYRIKSNPAKYDFCDYNGNFTSDADECISCLYDNDDLTILGNILTTLKQICVTKPGKDVGIDADVYKPSEIKLAAATGSPSPTNSPTPTNASDSDSGISAGVIAGIVLGVLVVLILILLGALFFLRRLKNKRKVIEMPKGEEIMMPNSQYSYNAVPQQRDAHP